MGVSILGLNHARPTQSARPPRGGPAANNTRADETTSQKAENENSNRHRSLRRNADGGPSADSGYKVAYDGGSLLDTKSGTAMKLHIDSNQIRFTRDKAEVVTIPAASVTEISYGQDVHRRVGAAIGLGLVSFGIGALMALSKSKKHFIGLTWDDAGKKGGAAFQADKNDYRGVLEGLEGITGKKAVNSEALTVKN